MYPVKVTLTDSGSGLGGAAHHLSRLRRPVVHQPAPAVGARRPSRPGPARRPTWPGTCPGPGSRRSGHPRRRAGGARDRVPGRAGHAGPRPRHPRPLAVRPRPHRLRGGRPVGLLGPPDPGGALRARRRRRPGRGGVAGRADRPAAPGRRRPGGARHRRPRHQGHVGGRAPPSTRPPSTSWRPTTRISWCPQARCRGRRARSRPPSPSPVAPAAGSTGPVNVTAQCHGHGVRRRARGPAGVGQGSGRRARRGAAAGRGVAHLLRGAQPAGPGGNAGAARGGGGGAGGVGPERPFVSSVLLPGLARATPSSSRSPSTSSSRRCRWARTTKRRRATSSPRRRRRRSRPSWRAPCARRGPARPASPARWPGSAAGAPPRRPPTTCSWRRSRACCRRASNRPRLAGFEAALNAAAAGPVGALRHHPPHRRHGQRAHHAAAQHGVSRDGGGAAHERQAPVPHGATPRCPGPSARPRRCRARRDGRASRRCARSTTPPTPCTSTCRRGPRATSRSHVALESPAGDLVLAGGQLTVRSLSTSAVAIALSVGAALVLLVWWGRTVWRGKARRGAHTAAAPRGSTA